MPVLASSKRALKQALRNKKINDRVRKKMKEAIKAFRIKPSKEALRLAYSAIDMAKKKKVIHKNKAARLKSRLTKILSSLQT